MNSHLNVFRHYAESDWENNLTRAFGITLMNDPLFFSKFFEEVTGEKLFEVIELNPNIEIDTQKSIRNISEDFEILYPVALTTTNLDVSNSESRLTSKPILDLMIKIDNICILIEAKISPEDCIAQLNNQVEIFREKYKEDELKVKEVKSIRWDEIISSAEKIQNYKESLNQKSFVIDEFLGYLKIHYASWFPVKKFYEIEAPTSHNSSNWHELNKRLDIIKREVSRDSLEEYRDRVAISLDKPWAREINFGYDIKEKNLKIQMWPGDTKGQGYQLFRVNKDIGFLKLNNAEEMYENMRLKYGITPYIKFAHFNRGIMWYHFDIVKEYDYRDLFNKLAGKWKSDKWGIFESIMETEVDKEWVSKCSWKSSIIDSNRTYFTASLGFEISCKLDYRDLQTLEKQGETVGFIKGLIGNIVDKVEGN